MRKLLLTCLFAVLVSLTAKAQMTQFKALYIYNFAKNVGWPEDDSGNEFVITVIGDNDLAEELQKLAATRKVGIRTVVVKQAATAASAQHSQIFYLAETKSRQISTLVSSSSKSQSLIISGKQGQCSLGAGISFISSAGKLSYEISNNNIKKGGITIATKITQLGVDVD